MDTNSNSRKILLFSDDDKEVYTQHGVELHMLVTDALVPIFNKYLQNVKLRDLEHIVSRAAAGIVNAALVKVQEKGDSKSTVVVNPIATRAKEVRQPNRVFVKSVLCS